VFISLTAWRPGSAANGAHGRRNALDSLDEPVSVSVSSDADLLQVLVVHLSQDVQCYLLLVQKLLEVLQAQTENRIQTITLQHEDNGGWLVFDDNWSN
jgi:hypothetical protein